MKKKISVSIFSAVLLLFVPASCQRQLQTAVKFGADTESITLGAEGGTETVHISAEEGWVANSTSPWISISPANGSGSSECSIIVDTTLIADGMREGVVRFTSKSTDGATADVKVFQTGYEKMIVLSKTEESVPSYDEYSKRYVEVNLTSNVEFTANVEADRDWVQLQDYKFTLDRGSRPRTVRLRLRWENNTRPSERQAVLSFTPADGETLAKNDRLVITQTAAEEIEDSRKGDSLAIVGCARSLNFSMSEFEGESMDHWTFVSLWEKGDKGYTEDKQGRVRAVKFSFFETKDGIPYEVQFLRKVEDLTFFSNADWYRREFTSGEYIAKLTQLRRLEITALGLVGLDEDFANLKNLEELGLVANNFNTLPDVLTPENFPKLKKLDLSSNRRTTILDMSSTTYDRSVWGGFVGEFPERLLHWDNLEYLRLSFNYIYGKLPDMKDYGKVYTEEDILASRDTLPNGVNNPAGYSLIGKPKVLPNAKFFGINLNLLEGEIPEWVLYHPHLGEWDAETLVFNQSTEMNNLQGERPGFSNTPVNLDYYYRAYPLKKPDYYVEGK